MSIAVNLAGTVVKLYYTVGDLGSEGVVWRTSGSTHYHDGTWPVVALNSSGGVAEMHVDTAGDATYDVGQVDGGSIRGISDGQDLAAGNSPAIAIDDEDRLVAGYVVPDLWTTLPGLADLDGGTVQWGAASSGASDAFLVDVAVSAGKGLAVAILALDVEGAGAPLNVATMVGSL